MNTHNQFESFEAVIRAVRAASTIDGLNALVDQVNVEFEADTLEISPENWAMLSSETLLRCDKIRTALKPSR
ncbi:hypothetical protein [Pseudomonas syringae]|uniref:hypothetical protein n=1 Tax=Pseudomonas syringae TaxID=317 RepID=UPI001F39CCF9|nr:hypothetical protein [Pseudomonas syringae]MCF5374493.1 hypothetical protein [Pseudomonas syringae]MCF5381978.1 hypothetical protein [Pseudomonas syringae]MCF5419490.1 hypothetical protein [Pseudomonas syringae]MCF5454836.1 hypothetical protein [Pseudomonas syringae]MCF5456322.1 hypothetical protein [Pseudomonas syringae]